MVGLASGVALVCAVAVGAADPAWPFADRRREFGGAVAPVVLPNGALALYGHAGFPDIDVGFRQGFGGFEFEGRFWFDYYRVTPGVELGARAFSFRQGALDFAPFVAIGVAQDFGSTYFDPLNQFYFGARVRAGANASLRITDAIYALVRLDLPFERAVTEVASFRFFPTAGIGSELYLAEDVTLSVLGRAGAEWLSNAPELIVRPTFAVHFGLGFRLF